MPSRDSSKPHVLILGAGLGGLTLAQALRKQGISYEIFERDEAVHSRFQGWAIALHFIIPDLNASLPDDMPPLSTTSHLQPLEIEPSMCMYDENGEKLASIQSYTDDDLIRANRSRLRDWLTTKLDINWGKHMTRIEEGEDSVTLHFKDGSTATGDVLVGADGIHSPVRHHLLDGKDKLSTLPLGFIVGETTLNKEQYEKQLKLAHSAYVVSGEGHKTDLFVGLNSISEDASTAKYYWFMSWKDPEAANEPYWTHSKTKQELYGHATERAKSLPPAQAEIVSLTSPEGMMTPPIVIRDMILKELPNRRITLLGDAAHPMTPFRGEGGNNALMDSLNLARALTKSSREDVLANLKDYQDEMLQRTSVAVAKSRQATIDRSETTRAWRDWTAGRHAAAAEQTS